MLTFEENIINDIIDNDNVEKLISFYQEQKLQLNYTNDQQWSMAFIASLNNCTNIYSYLSQQNMLDTDFLSSHNSVRVAVEEKNYDIVAIAVKHFENNKAAINSIVSYILKNNDAKALSLINIEKIDFSTIVKIAQSNIENKQEFLLNTIKTIDIHNKEKVSSDFEDLGSLCVQHNLDQCLTYLIDNEYMFSQFNKFEDLMTIAVDNKAFQAVSCLVEAGLDLSKDQITICTNYVSKTFDQRLLNLLRQDVYFSTFANKDGENNLLLKAIKYNNIELINWCLEKKVNINKVDEDNNSALILAVEKGNADLVCKLKDLGINLNIKDHNGNNALLLAVAQDNEEIVKILTHNVVSHAIGVNDKNNYDVDSISLAIHRKNYEILSYLFFLAPNLSFQDLSTPTTHGDIGEGFMLESSDLDASQWRVEGLDALFALGYNFNIKNELGENIINCYCKKSNNIIDIANLLDVGVDINEPNNNGYNAVEVCISKGFGAKLNMILNKRDYTFESSRLDELLNQCPDKKTIVTVLLNNHDFLKTDISMNLLTSIVINENSLIEKYVSLKKLSVHQKNELLLQSVICENSTVFTELLNDLDKHSLEQEFHILYSQSSEKFKQENKELYNSLFKTNKLRIK